MKTAIEIIDEMIMEHDSQCTTTDTVRRKILLEVREKIQGQNDEVTNFLKWIDGMPKYEDYVPKIMDQMKYGQLIVQKGDIVDIDSDDPVHFPRKNSTGVLKFLFFCMLGGMLALIISVMMDFTINFINDLGIIK